VSSKLLSYAIRPRCVVIRQSQPEVLHGASRGFGSISSQELHRPSGAFVELVTQRLGQNDVFSHSLYEVIDKVS
jgi:hypothetical protein